MFEYYKRYGSPFIGEMNVHKKTKKSTQEDFFVKKRDNEEVG